MTIKEILSSPGIIGLVGVIIGSSISLIGNWIMTSREAKLRIAERIYDRRAKAHEGILEICQALRTTVSTEQADAKGNVMTYPAPLQSRYDLEELILSFSIIVNSNLHLIDIKVYRYLNFIQDYLASVHISLKSAPDAIYPEIALVLKQDFIDLAGELHDLTMEFFDKGSGVLNSKTKRGHHKYKRERTHQMLAKTRLKTEWEEIEKK